MLLAALFLLAAAPDGAPAKPAQSAQVEVSAKAVALSRLLNPEDKMAALVVHALDTGFHTALLADTAEAKVFDQHPGLAEAILSAARPVISAHVSKSSPRMLRRFAGFYAGRFTSDELDTLIAFYSSPTGVKMIEGMYSGVNLSILANKLNDDPEAKLATSDVSAITRSTVQRIFPVFNDSDKAALLTFARKPVYPKLQRAIPAFHKLVAEVANEPDPELDSAMKATVKKAVKEFLAKEGRSASVG
ncbi:DUF2059 domain-containing protein [Sphingomonas sp. GCM10030256]|uniref:DUF2059 domain-containing protein n=1 Tax=Sphingomonas sp. GCM10030256 TaxID=3273427 RepID=UPI00360BFCB1